MSAMALVARAQGGDDEAFRALTEPHRRELQLHCYRILGSLQDAEDMVQETLLAAWRSLASFEGRSSVRSWLYKIATNRCLNALRTASRRPVPAVMDAPRPTNDIEPLYLEPYPDTLLDPAARYETKETVELAFIAALQGLPPRQRAVLVLRDVLGFQAGEVAAILETGDAAVKGALQRARAAVKARPRAAERARRPDSARERELVARFAEAVENGDIDALVALLSEDGRLTMPPLPLEYIGHADIAAFLRHRAELRRASLQVVVTSANTQPALACYLHGEPWGLVVLTLAEDAIGAMTWFADTALFRYFDLPSTSEAHTRSIS
jgi:RNA polymerase sigma-70 factor (TIGR02960 family)